MITYVEQLKCLSGWTVVWNNHTLGGNTFSIITASLRRWLAVTPSHLDPLSVCDRWRVSSCPYSTAPVLLVPVLSGSRWSRWRTLTCPNWTVSPPSVPSPNYRPYSLCSWLHTACQLHHVSSIRDSCQHTSPPSLLRCTCRWRYWQWCRRWGSSRSSHSTAPVFLVMVLPRAR